MIKYRIGDKVKVKSNLKVNCGYGNGAFFTKDMVKFLNQEATIVKVIYDYKEGDGSYYLDIDKKREFMFTDRMLESIKNIPCEKDEKIIKHTLIDQTVE